MKAKDPTLTIAYQTAVNAIAAYLAMKFPLPLEQRLRIARKSINEVRKVARATVHGDI